MVLIFSLTIREDIPIKTFQDFKSHYHWQYCKKKKKKKYSIFASFYKIRVFLVTPKIIVSKGMLL
jgi:hypothetical protein